MTKGRNSDAAFLSEYKREEDPLHHSNLGLKLPALKSVEKGFGPNT